MKRVRKKILLCRLNVASYFTILIKSFCSKSCIVSHKILTTHISETIIIYSFIFSAVEVWNTCINGTVGTCDGQAINYWKTLTQKYIDLFCTNSLAPETKQLSSIVVTVSLLCNIYFIYFTGFS